MIEIEKWIIKVLEGLPNLLRVFREGLRRGSFMRGKLEGLIEMPDLYNYLS